MRTFQSKSIILFLFLPLLASTAAAQGVGLGIKKIKSTTADHQQAIQSTLPFWPHSSPGASKERQPGFENQQSFHLLYYESGRQGAGVDWNPHREYGKGCEAGAAIPWSQGEAWLNKIREAMTSDQPGIFDSRYLQGFKDGLYLANQKEFGEIEFNQILRNGLPMRVEKEWRQGFATGMVATKEGATLDQGGQSTKWNEGFEQAKLTKQMLTIERENQKKSKVKRQADF